MSVARHKVQMSEAYAATLGRAVFVFSVLEWNIVWCLEQMVPSYVRSVNRKTSGRIAKDCSTLSANVPDMILRDALQTVALEFSQLVEQRNGLIHANPGTALDGAQLLSRDGTPWTEESVAALADEFADCSSKANAILHGALGPALNDHNVGFR